MKILLLAAIFVALSADAHDRAKVNSVPKTSEGSEFKLDKGLLDSMYRSATSETSVDTERYSAGVEMTPIVSIVRPLEFSLTNLYYQSSTVDNLPLFQLQFSRLMGAAGGFLFNGSFRLGYGYTEGASDAHPVRDAELHVPGEKSRDVIKLHWIPLSVGSRMAYEIPGVPWIKPALNAGVGIQYISRTGKLDGLDQGFWVPLYFGGAAVTLFDMSDQPGAWFGGLTLGATYQNSLGSTQRVRFVSWDLGATIHL